MFDFGLLNFDRCVETKTEFDEENIICTDYETFKLKTLF